MREALAPVAALLASVAVLLTGNGLLGTLLPIRAEMEMFSTFSIGMLGSAYYAGFGLGCFISARIIRHVGHIRTYTAMTAIVTAATLLYSLAVGPAAWWALRAISGVCFAILYVVIESWLNERSSNDTRGAVLSAYLVINLTVITVGQMLVTLADPRGFALFSIAAIVLCLAAVPVAMSTAMAPAPVESVAVRLGSLYRISPVGFVSCFGIGLANGSFWALAPVFAGQNGLVVTGIALFMSATVLGGAVGQWPLGRLSDGRDRRRVMAAACAGGILAAVALVMLNAEHRLAMLAVGAVWGAFAFPLYSLAVALTNDHAAPNEFVEVSGGLLLTHAAGAAVGPLVASTAMGFAGPPALYAFTATVHAALGAYALWRIRQRAPAPVAEQVPFLESLEASKTVSPVFDGQIQAEHISGEDAAA